MGAETRFREWRRIMRIKKSKVIHNFCKEIAGGRRVKFLK
jgi:hypothetical protein